MDHHGPGLDGLDAIRRIRSLRSTAVIDTIALTVPRLSRDRDRNLDVGADACEVKPFVLLRDVRGGLPV
ncbi:response regulator [Aquisphaera giovannonii]|nr:hypothetical protein [Aquisphaera giovannonii]